MNTHDQIREKYQKRLESALDKRLPGKDVSPENLHRALRYACLGGGKRLRAMLVYVVGEEMGAALNILDVPACAVELIHAYSLVHDDLPCMDDDTLRRGQPTCHVAFGEATALLAGDAAQTLAFELLARDSALDVSSEQKIEMIGVLSEATGTRGMAGGQSLDMDATNQQLSQEALTTLHRMKTGALIKASCLLGGLAAPSVSTDQLELLKNYGNALGLAFQVKDDILDVTANTETLGKTAGADEKMKKSTYVTIMGLEAARQTCADLCAEAVESARLLGDNRGMLASLAQFAGNRSF
ncbi:MAG: polyprenyl synthetase family protein [Acidiferrobacterales bacterium]|nr:polyprenyl synthetase family protein [Acidiferrobacterales bacterium]